MSNGINELTNPKRFQGYLNINKQEVNSYIKMLRSMTIIRKAEQNLAWARKNGLIGGPVHLAAGQEGIAVGISKNLRKTDRVFGNHRSHAHLLALNSDIYKLFAEILGKETGFSKGMGGSMHLFDKSNGFYGSTPIVAGTVPLAVGAGLASKMQKQKTISVSYIGDGAVEEGVVHECFNLAKVLKVPILFVIENNLFASHMHISLRQPSDMISRFADANYIPYKLLDGNDVVEVAKQSKKMIDQIRSGEGPGLIELVTYRLYGHVDWREDVDVGVARSSKDIKDWKARDPIKRLSESMIDIGIWDKENEKILNTKVDIDVNKAWDKAMQDKYPSKDSILKYVYSLD